MVQSKSIQKLDKSNVKLSLTISGEETQKAYDKLLGDYAKKAQIKGFRPGKVPTSVLETKYGDSLKIETAQEAIEASLKTVLAEIEEKPLPYAQPVLDEGFSFVPGQDFCFAVTYDVFPSVGAIDQTGMSYEDDQVSIGKEDLELELKQLQEQNSIMAESEGPIVSGDMVSANFWELDGEGNEVPGSKRQDFVFTIGQNSNYYLFDDEVIAAKKGQTLSIDKTYAADYENPELAGRTVKISLEVSRIRRKDLPDLDDELAQDIDEKYKTLDDLKKDIKERLEKTAENKLRQKKITSIIEQLLSKQEIVVPESMVNAELYQKYDHMVRQLGGKEQTLLQLLAAQGSSPQTLIDSWRPLAEKEIKSSLIIRELIKSEKIEVSEEELNEEIKKQGALSNMDQAAAREFFEKNNYLDQLKNAVEEKKLFDALFAKAKAGKGKKIKYADLVKAHSHSDSD